MTLLEQHDQLIRKKIAAMPQGKEAGLAAIFGDDWEQIGTPGQRKEFGRLVISVVVYETYVDMTWVRIESSGGFDV